MMGSSHLDHFHQEELHGFSSLATVPSFCDLASSREWNQNQILNCGDLISNNANGGVLSGHRDNFSLIHDISPVSSHMIQRDLGFHWHSRNEEGFLNQPQANQVNAEKVKEEYLPNYSSFLKLAGQSNGDYQLHEKLFVRALASDCQADGLQPLPGHLPESTSFDDYRGAREGFNCMAFPAANLSHSDLNPPVISEMDFGALDLLASARLGRSLCQPSLTLLRDQDHVSSGLEHLHESIQGPFYLEQKMPSLVSGVTEVSRSSNSTWEHKSSQSAPMRKPRFEQRSSFSPFKVRKEKLGDRIAALQQLVAPFGKTDTASVLMEAIGYIKFLLDQVEKLSVPYMRPSGNKRSRIVQEASDEEGSEEARRDLRSRGLCLVPLSCTSYMTSEHGSVWSPSNYGGSV